MDKLGLFAKPWWVNLLILVPLVAYSAWRRRGLALTNWTLIAAAVFGTAFGFVEASVVVYLRTASGLLPAYNGTLSDIARQSTDLYQQSQALTQVPEGLLGVEVFREAATLVMLIAVALLAVRTRRECCAIFLWTFAVWDIFYYVGLWATVRWPPSLWTSDVLFLIPVPWFSPVWFPILVSVLTMIAVILARKTSENLPKV